MERKDRLDRFGVALMVSQSFLLGLNQVLIKVVNSGMQPVFQAGMRSACAILPVLLYALLMRKRLSLSDGSFWPGLLCGSLFGFEFIFLFLALDMTTVAHASVIFYSMPVWLAIAAHFLIPGETMSRLRALGLFLACAGTILALSDGLWSETGSSLLGNFLALAGAMLWAGIALLARMSRLRNSGPEMQLLYQLVVSSFILIPAAFFFGPFLRDLTPAILGIFAFQVIVVISIGFVVWFWVLSIYPASDMAAFSFLSPVFGVLLSWLILGERLTPAVLGALVLVSLGIVLINRKRKR